MSSNGGEGSGGEAPRAGGKHKGRPRADVWTLFTENETPQRLVSCVCRHCGELVSHRKKSERAKGHLAKKCAPFRELMLAIHNENERPDWFNELSVKPRKRASEAAAVGRGDGGDGDSSAGGRSTKRAKAEAVDTQLNVQQQETLDEHLALHFYVTGTPFARIEDEFLRRAFSVGRPHVELPGRQQLAGVLLDKCYNKVKALVETRNSNSQAASQSQVGLNVGGENAVVMACVQLIKDVFAPTVAEKKQDKSATTATETSPFTYLASFVQDCNTLVTFFTEEDAQMKSKLEKAQQTLGVEPLVPFNPRRQYHYGTNLKPCLDAIKRSEDLIYDLVNAADFVGEYTILSLKPKAVEQRQRVLEIVTGGSFLEHLDKSLELLTPIYATMAVNRVVAVNQSAASAAATQMPVSSEYHSFCVTLKDELAKLLLLTSTEHASLSALVAKELMVLSGGNAGVAYLLDPRFLGEGMSGDERDRAEDQLFDFFHRSPDNDETEDDEEENVLTPVTDPELDRKREQLFREYTAFVIKSNSLKQQGGFRFQMLVKGTKTIQQYWLTDGQQFPLLQQVALAVFKAKNDASSNGNGTVSNVANEGAALVTPIKGSAHAARTAATPPSASSARKNREGLDTDQLLKLAFIKAHASLLLDEYEL